MPTKLELEMQIEALNKQIDVLKQKASINVSNCHIDMNKSHIEAIATAVKEGMIALQSLTDDGDSYGIYFGEKPL